MSASGATLSEVECPPPANQRSRYGSTEWKYFSPAERASPFTGAASTPVTTAVPTPSSQPSASPPPSRPGCDTESRAQPNRDPARASCHPPPSPAASAVVPPATTPSSVASAAGQQAALRLQRQEPLAICGDRHTVIGPLGLRHSYGLFVWQRQPLLIGGFRAKVAEDRADHGRRMVGAG